MAQVANKALIFLNGALYDSENGATLKTGGKTREPVMSDNKHVGPSESIKNSTVEATFIQTADVSVQALNDFTGTITFQQDIGTSFVIANGYSAGDATLSKGKITVTLYGDPAEQA